ncbi:MAG: hypothetical protein QOJ23_1832 [Actinomycetota bacterium]|jgi:hypothetical protein|nr:hypothetical protein [Actinomycetota bacterium]
MGHRTVKSARRFAAPAGVSLLLALLSPPASADSGVASFNVFGRGALMHLYMSVPEAVLPFTVEGGIFDSYGKIESAPHSFGYAGAVPVPLATSAGIVLPEQIPENVREGIRSVDYKALPNYCQADFPESRDGSGESYCGGPAQPEKSLGVTGAVGNGHVKATGDFDNLGRTSILSESRIAELALPGLQSRILGGATSFRSLVNDEGIPVAEASARIESLSVLGSLVRFDQIESSANVVNDGTEEGSAGKVSLTIARAAVAGIPVQVSSDGVTVSEPVNGLSPQQATESVNKALADAGGASIRLLPGSGVQRDGNRLIAQSPSLVIEYNAKTPTPAHVIEEFGLAEINALAQGARPSAPVEFSSGGTDSGSSAPDGTDKGANEAAGSAELTTPQPETAAESYVGSSLGTEGTADRSPTVLENSESALVGPGGTLDSDSSGGTVNITTSVGDPALLAENAAGNGAVLKPSGWVRAWYALLAGLLPVAAVVNAALKKTDRSLLRRPTRSA